LYSADALTCCRVRTKTHLNTRRNELQAGKEATAFSWMAKLFPSACDSCKLAAQQPGCQSRLTEQAFEKILERKYGPPAFAQIQAIGAGQPVQMTFTVTSMQSLGALPGGYPGEVCSVAGNFWRGDTGQTITVVSQSWVVTDPTYGSQIQVKSISP
jgi:hypothetical protein